MTDEQHGADEAEHEFLQSGDPLDVPMIAWLVQEQEVRIAH